MQNGDDRKLETILRSIQRMASGEMRVLLTFMVRGKRRRLAAKVGQDEGLRDE
jgi:hypothetical protein